MNRKRAYVIVLALTITLIGLQLYNMYLIAYPPPDPYEDVPLNIRITLDYNYNETITVHRINCVLQTMLDSKNVEKFALIHTHDAIFVGEPITKVTKLTEDNYGFMINISEDKQQRYSFSMASIRRASYDSWGYYKGVNTWEFYLPDADDPVPCTITVELGPRVGE